MLNSFASNAITAKARAIYGNRLTASDYHELLRQRTVSDIAAYLKNSTSYSVYLKGINETAIHRGQLENLINRTLYEKFFGLCNFDFSRNNGFYHHVIVDAEITILLQAIMLLNSNSPQNIIVSTPSYIQKHACFDFVELSKIKSFRDLISVLASTPYKAVLQRFDAENGKIDNAGCELALKTYYYRFIFSTIDKNFKGKTREEIRKLILLEIELTNLNLIYRMKRHFKMPPEEIKCRLLPFFYKITPRALSLLLEDEKREDFIKHMRLNAYNYKMKDISFQYIEDYTKNLLFLLVHGSIHFSTNAAISFFALITLTRIEIENLTNIIEGVRYQVPLQEIQKLLITE